MNSLSANDLEALNDKLVRVEIPSAGGSVWLRRLTSSEQLELDQLEEQAKADKKDFVRVFHELSLCLVDENRNQLFPGAEGQERLKRLPVGLMRSLMVVCQNINLIPDIEELSKNCEAVQRGVSSSVSVHC